jgi:hypothetical protein
MPAGPSLSLADGLAVAAAWLAAHPDVIAALGGPGRVSGVVGPLYPCVRITGGPGSDRDLRWVKDDLVTVEVWGDPDGTPGPAALKRVMYRVLEALTELPARPVTPGDAIVTAVVSVNPAQPVPVDGQPRWTAAVLLTVHPPRVG